MAELAARDVLLWGDWVKEKEGLFTLHSSLSNRLVDAEFTSHFLSNKEIDDHYPTNVMIHQSRAARLKLQELATELAITTCPVSVVVPYEKSSENLLKYNETCEREFAYGINRKNQKNYVLPKKYEIDPVLNQAIIHPKHLMPHDIELIHSEHKGKTQNIFIDLNTLVNLYEYNAHLWKFFSILSMFSGIPLAVQGTHSGWHESLSPIGSWHDPIVSVIYAMWGLGFADNFRVALSLNHRDIFLRGVYLSFDIGGKGAEALIDGRGMFDMPNSLKNQDGKIDIMSLFEQSMKEGVESTLQ